MFTSLNMMVYSLVDFNSSGVIKEVGNTHITYTSNQTGECIKIQPNQVTNNPALIIRQRSKKTKNCATTIIVRTER